MRDSFLHEVTGMFPSKPDEEVPEIYRHTPSAPVAPVVDGSPSEPSEGDSPITEQPENPI